MAHPRNLAQGRAVGLGALVCALASLLGGPALAGEAPVPAVASRLYSLQGRFELGARAGLELLPGLTSSYSFGLAAAYHPAEWGAVELRVGHALGGNTSLARDAAARLYGLAAPQVTELRDTWRLGLHALAGFRFQPVYGKVNLLAELPVHFQLYGWAGAGAVRLERTSPTLCLYPKVGDVDPGRCVQGGAVRWDAYLSEVRISPLVSLALGLRVFLAQHHALQLEVRSWSYLDRYYQGIQRALVSPQDPAGGGRPAGDAGITTVGQLELGYSYVF